MYRIFSSCKQVRSINSFPSVSVFLTDQMSDVCKKYFLRDLYRKIDGAVLTSQNERDLDCAITFQTHSILQRFMLRFDQLQLDCNDHLYIYDGAHAVGSYKVSRNYEIYTCGEGYYREQRVLGSTAFVANYRGVRFDKTSHVFLMISIERIKNTFSRGSYDNFVIINSRERLMERKEIWDLREIERGIILVNWEFSCHT